MYHARFEEDALDCQYVGLWYLVDWSSKWTFAWCLRHEALQATYWAAKWNFCRALTSCKTKQLVGKSEQRDDRGIGVRSRAVELLQGSLDKVLHREQIRPFNAFAIQPRMSLVTRTLAAAHNDRLHVSGRVREHLLTYALIGALRTGGTT